MISLYLIAFDIWTSIIQLLTYELHLTAFPKPQPMNSQNMFTTHLFRFRWIIRNLKVIGPNSPTPKTKKKLHLQLFISSNPHRSFRRLWPWSFCSISWFLDLPAGSNWLQQNAGKFYNFLGFFMGVVEPLTPKKNQQITGITYVWQTNPQTPPFNFGKIRIRLIQQKPTRIGSQSRNLLSCFGGNFSVCGCGFA